MVVVVVGCVLLVFGRVLRGVCVCVFCVCLALFVVWWLLVVVLLLLRLGIAVYFLFVLAAPLQSHSLRHISHRYLRLEDLSDCQLRLRPLRGIWADERLLGSRETLSTCAHPCLSETLPEFLDFIVFWEDHVSQATAEI